MKKQSPVVVLIAETQYKTDGHKGSLKGAEAWLRNKYLSDAKKVARALDKAGMLPVPVSRETPGQIVVTMDSPVYGSGSPYPPSLLNSPLTQRR